MAKTLKFGSEAAGLDERVYAKRAYDWMKEQILRLT